jgi:hypothetical protein
MRNKTLRGTWVKALGMDGLGGSEGTISDRCAPLRYFGRRVLKPCVAAKDKSVRPVVQSVQYLASEVRVGCYNINGRNKVLLFIGEQGLSLDKDDNGVKEGKLWC